MLDLLNDIAHYGPSICLKLSPETVFAPLYQALVCGTALPASEYQQLFLDTGLIHLMVVSGAHLAFLDKSMDRWPEKPRWAVLFFYAWLTGFGPPIVRALVRRALGNFGHHQGLSPLQLDFVASLSTLLIRPDWVVSRSFLMSWMCSLALSFPFGPLPFRCFLFLYPFAPGAPVAVFWNAVITPVIGNLLFPLCLASFLLHPLTALCDRLWEVFLFLLRIGPHAPGATWFLSTRSLIWLPLFVHILLMAGEIRWRRALAFSSSQ